MDLFRVPVIALVIGWILGAVFTKILIPFLEKKQFRQFVREVGPQSHLSKTGTPSMGWHCDRQCNDHCQPDRRSTCRGDQLV